MPNIPGLLSPRERTGGIVYFARMLSKIRLHSRGELPQEYVDFLGPCENSFDWRCSLFLGVDYEKIAERTLQGGSDEEILGWAFENGRKPTDQEIEVWNGFMTKRGWKDTASDRLKFRCEEAGFGPECGIETMFDFLDVDEGRQPGG